MKIDWDEAKEWAVIVLGFVKYGTIIFAFYKGVDLTKFLAARYERPTVMQASPGVGMPDFHETPPRIPMAPFSH